MTLTNVNVNVLVTDTKIKFWNFELFEKFNKTDFMNRVGYPFVKFTNLQEKMDELWGVDNNKFWSSSYFQGHIEWSKDNNQYVKYYKYKETNIGDFESIFFDSNKQLSKVVSNWLNSL